MICDLDREVDYVGHVYVLVLGDFSLLVPSWENDNQAVKFAILVDISV